ncbi:MAG TPA: hypothetical protein VJ850_02415 [Candidatus Limnocylindrales bacterium]|nr:hypothetical protein [Candidatus Limnocylindrales bacterium]
MRLALFRAALLSTVCLVAACNTAGPGTTSSPGAATAPGGTGEAAASIGEVSAEQVAESLMVALRDGHTTEAWTIVSTGLAPKKFNGIADFTAKMIAAGTPASWTFDPLKHGSNDSGSFVVVEGPVTFEDGGVGHVRIQMTALGLQANPWRVDEFTLTDK